MKRLLGTLLAALALTGCARQSDVNRLELQVRRLREETARADSARAVLLSQVLTLQRRILDSLALQENRLVAFRGDIRSDLTEVQRQLVQIQELTGQSQQRLSDLRSQIENRAAQAAVSRAPGDTLGATTGLPAAGQLFDISMQQHRRGSTQAARLGFQTFLNEYPTHERAPDAQFFLGETWEKANPDSAGAAYELVVQRHRDSARAPTALYRLGLLAEQRRDRAAARSYFQRLLVAYPRSEEAPLAREKLQPGR